MKTIIQLVPDCENCAGQTEWYQPNFAYQCHFCGHIGKIIKQPTKQEIEEEVKRIKGI
jgi:ribosomal protein S27E